MPSPVSRLRSDPFSAPTLDRGLRRERRFHPHPHRGREPAPDLIRAARRGSAGSVTVVDARSPRPDPMPRPSHSRFYGVLHHLLRALVLPQPLERGMPQDRVGRPFGVTDLCDEAGIDPVHAVSRNAFRQRHRGNAPLHRGEPRVQFRKNGVAEPGANAAGVTQLALADRNNRAAMRRSRAACRSVR